MANSTHLDVSGYADQMTWIKNEDENGRLRKTGIFPITRYPNVLNRPRTITEGETLAQTPNADFHLLTTDVEEVVDDKIFELFGQTW